MRLGSYALLGAGLLFYFAVLGGIAWLFGQVWGPLAFIILLLAFGGAWGIVRWIQRYYFYLLNAAHAAVMTEYIVHGKNPDDGQIAYGKEQVTSRFRDTSLMFGIDVLIDGVVKAITRKVANVVGLLPIPGMKSLKLVMERLAKYSTTYIDKAILTLAYRRREPNVWKVAQDGVILYAQCWKPILANAAALTLLSYVEFFIFLAILGIPAIALAALVPALSIPLGIFVIVGAWMLKLALADAFGMAATILAFHRSIEGMEPDPTWKRRLEQISDQFRELRDKAREHASDMDIGRSAGTGADASPTDRPPSPSQPGERRHGAS